MKKNVIIAGLVALAGITNAQTFNPPGSTPATSVFRKGMTGFGMNVPPLLHMVEIETAIPNDGLSITQLSNGASLIKLNNNGPGGFNWSLNSNNNGSSPAGGYFLIKNLSMGSAPFMIDGNSDNVGIGTISPTIARLQVEQNNGDIAGNFQVNASISSGPKTGIYGSVNSVVSNTIYGVYGNANLNNLWSGFATAVNGFASGGQFNTGGNFQGVGNNTSFNYGIYAAAYGGSANEYAGYFMGNVFRSGSDNFTSDRKLKQNIEPLTNALDKLLQLKPSTYNYRTAEFADMNLPKGKQMGLIAQELEQIFPELVTTISAMQVPDKNGNTKSFPEFKAVQYISLIPVLISAIQEQQAQIEELKKGQKTTGITTIGNSENSFVMGQNEPNPFTGETVIPYTLPQQINKAYLAVYDLSGKQVASFPINERGSSSLKLSSEKLSAGIYIYSIIADGKIMDSKKMVVTEK